MRASILIALTTFVPITTVGVLRVFVTDIYIAGFVGFILIATVFALVPAWLRECFADAFREDRTSWLDSPARASPPYRRKSTNPAQKRPQL